MVRARRQLLGCLIVAGGCGEPSEAADSTEAAPTFVRDVGPLLHRECAPCHYAAGPGPFPLVTYDDATDHATDIVDVTGRGFMPPWLPAEGFGRFAGERRLSAAERDTLRQWAEAGRSRGEGTLPPVPTPPDGWRLGTPDLELTAAEAFTVPADGLDVYRNFVIHVPDGPPKFVRAVELRPGDPKLVHHAVLRVDTEGRARQRDAADPQAGFDGMIFAGARMPGGRFIGWTPGKAPAPGSDDRSWRLVGGSDLVLQVHLRPSGKEESVQPRVGLYYAARPPTKPALAMELSSTRIDIAPGEAAYRVRDRYAVPADVLVHSVYPHAHYLGKALHGYAELPDGSTKWLVKIEDWDFNWQDQYRFARPVLLPKGTEVVMDFSYDNSAANPRNPSSPPRRVVHGPASTDEMAELILEIEPARPQDYAALDAAFMRKWTRDQIAAFERQLEADAQDPAVLATLAALHAQIKEHDRAAALYERSLSSRPEHASTRVDYAIVLAAQDRTADARAELQQAIATDPQLARAHSMLANIHRKRGDTKAAVAAYERSIALDPAVADVHNNLGVARREAGQFEAAARAFARAAELSPTRGLFRENQGRALQAAGDHAGAVAAYEAALERAPTSFRSLQGLAWIRATSKEHLDAKAARDLALQAVRLTQSRSPEVLDALAAAHAALGQWREAVGAAQRAVELAEAAKREDLAAPIRKRLALYRKRRPFVAP